MSTNKHFDRICIAAVILALLISVLFMNGEALGIQAQAKEMGYESRLFDTSKVHTIDIVIDDWDAFLATAQSEEYSVCNVVIDGEAFTKVGIRGKGNTSLSSVSSMDSDRYSFKIEFDQYDSTKSYYGLDKLSLNNLIQDNTMMKDYLTYQMMNEFGVAAPLCSYVYITVNGEDWGLYLAVEAVEESFLQRNYGSNYGQLYKPDSLSMGGGRGNGKDFDFEDFMDLSGDTDTTAVPSVPSEGTQGMMPGAGGDAAQQATMPENFDPTQMGSMVPGADGDTAQQATMPEGVDPTQMGGMMPGTDGDASQRPTMPEGSDPTQMGGMMPGADGDAAQQATMPEGFDPTQMGGVMPGTDGDTAQMPTMPEDFDFTDMGAAMPDSMGMGSSDVKLQYIDDEADSYSSIFDNVKTNVTDSDQQRLIASLKSLSEGTDISSVVDVEAVLRYFVVHNFVVNADSYTGSMVHNYYLYEKDGQLSMIPWDYNLAFGTFQGSNASSAVNDDIDAPLSVTGSDRPMIDWIFDSEEYTQQYHEYFQEFLDTVDVSAIIEQAKALIAPYVEKDPTKFCTYEEFEKGVQTLEDFCALRAESVAVQLSGSDTAVDASAISLSDMGTMNNGMGGGNIQMPVLSGGTSENAADGAQMGTMPDGTSGGDMPDGQGGMQRPGQSGGISEPSETEETAGETPEMETQAEIQMPEGMENMHGDRGDFQAMGQNSAGTAQSSNPWILLGVCLLVLAAGLIFAFKFKR